MTDWKPGDLALATVRGVPDVLVTYRGDQYGWPWQRIADENVLKASEVTDVRPAKAVPADAVVIELDDGFLAGWSELLVSLRMLRERGDLRLTLDSLIRQIEAQLPPPRPEEPTGLGAVVEAMAYTDEVRNFVRREGVRPWVDATGSGHEWPELREVIVRSEGWSE